MFFSSSAGRQSSLCGQQEVEMGLRTISTRCVAIGHTDVILNFTSLLYYICPGNEFYNNNDLSSGVAVASGRWWPALLIIADIYQLLRSQKSLHHLVWLFFYSAVKALSVVLGVTRTLKSHQHF